jgi:RNA polymerase sigma-70 factor (ECF subfamily)
MISVKIYNEAVHEYTKNVFRFLMKSLKDEQAAEDLLQDCFLKLWENRQTVDQLKVKSWLFAVAHNSMINYLKKAGRTTNLNGYENNVTVFQKHQFDLKIIIDAELSKLPPLQKSILLLRDLEGYEYKEIAEILELKQSQVKVYLFRARVKIKNSIKSIMNVI